MVSSPNTGWPQANVTSGITPMSPYSQNQTQHSVNQQVASNQRTNNMPALMKQLYSPSSGFSMGPANFASAAGPLSQAFAKNNQIKAMQPLQDYTQNAQSLLSGQQARESDALQSAQQFGQMQNMGWQQGLQNLQGTQALLSALYGGGY